MNEPTWVFSERGPLVGTSPRRLRGLVDGSGASAIFVATPGRERARGGVGTASRATSVPPAIPPARWGALGQFRGRLRSFCSTGSRSSPRARDIRPAGDPTRPGGGLSASFAGGCRGSRGRGRSARRLVDVRGPRVTTAKSPTLGRSERRRRPERSDRRPRPGSPTGSTARGDGGHPEPLGGRPRGLRGRRHAVLLDGADPCNDQNYGTIARCLGEHGLDGQFDGSVA
jgi:hypothetical protein